MLRTKHILLLFIPAILIGGFGLFIGIIQYEPLFPKERIENTEDDLVLFHIPLNAQDPILGNKKAPITVIAFEDFGCEHCKSLDVVLEQLLKKYQKKVKIIWKGLPVTQFPYNTTLAHTYAFCAHEQNKFTLFKAYAFENSDQLTPETLKIIAEKIGLNEGTLSTCLASGSAEAYTAHVESLARTLSIQAVPAIFFHDIQRDPPETLAGWEALLGLST